MNDGDVLGLVAQSIDENHPQETTATRRRFVAGAAGTLGAMGLIGGPAAAFASKGRRHDRRLSADNGDCKNNTPQTILNVAATAEVLATIVNTIGWERKLGGDEVTQRNVASAAREEKIHYDVLVASGAKPLTTKIWVPDSVFANRINFLSTLEVGDQIFINAYLIGVKVFGKAGNGKLALFAAETMATEAVHRALARQSLGKLGNDRVFMKYHQKEEAPDAPNVGTDGFDDILVAAAQLKAAGFGFGEAGSKPGKLYDYAEVSARTPDDKDLNTRAPHLLDYCD